MILSGASASILRQTTRPVAADAVTSTLSRNFGTFFISQFGCSHNQCKFFSSSSSSSRLLSSLPILSARATRSYTVSSFLLGNSHHSANISVMAPKISFSSQELSATINGIRLLHRSFSDKSNAATTTTSNKTGSSSKDAVNESEGGSSQHNTWVQFQRSIAVSGFETGQTTKERTLGKKNRGGKIDRKRKEREAEAEALLRGEDVTQLKGGEFPALRYSEDETERLLAEAYAAIPPRGGKRGTLNLKRQKRRHFMKRQYHMKKKFERIAAHERRMAKRKRIYDQIKKYQAEAGEVRAREDEYQKRVLLRWAEMNGHSREMTMVSN